MAARLIIRWIVDTAIAEPAIQPLDANGLIKIMPGICLSACFLAVIPAGTKVNTLSGNILITDRS